MRDSVPNAIDLAFNTIEFFCELVKSPANEILSNIIGILQPSNFPRKHRPSDD